MATDSTVGLADKPYSIDNANWQTSNEFTVEKSGTYTIYVKNSFDKISTKSIIIDMTAPVINNIKVDKGTITVTATDKESQLGDKAYSIDGESWQSNNIFTVAKTGKYTIYVKDINGNIASKTVEVDLDEPEIDDPQTDEPKKENEYIPKSDKGTPTVEVSSDGFVITVAASDKDSGLAEKAYSLDGTYWQESNKFTVEKDGQYMVYVRDKEGNVAKKLIVIKQEKENSNNSDSKNNNGSTNKNDNKATTDTNNAEDKTVTPAKKLPQTGVNLLIPITLITIAGIVAISYKKFKSIKLK